MDLGAPESTRKERRHRLPVCISYPLLDAVGALYKDGVVVSEYAQAMKMEMK